MNLKNRAQREQKKKNNRNRKVVWFKAPYSKQVSTNIAKGFLNLLDQHFPKEHRLYKICDGNNVKVSYSCTEIDKGSEKFSRSRVATRYH